MWPNQRCFTEQVWRDVWGRLHVVSKTFVVHLDSCFVSRVEFCMIFMGGCYYHRKLLTPFSKATWDLAFPKGKFHQWRRLTLAWTAAKESGLPHSPPFICLDDLVWHYTARVVFRERLFEGEAGQGCPFSSNEATCRTTPSVKQRSPGGMFPKQLLSSLRWNSSFVGFYVDSLFCHARVMHRA